MNKRKQITNRLTEDKSESMETQEFFRPDQEHYMQEEL